MVPTIVTTLIDGYQFHLSQIRVAELDERSPKGEGFEIVWAATARMIGYDRAYLVISSQSEGGFEELHWEIDDTWSAPSSGADAAPLMSPAGRNDVKR